MDTISAIAVLIVLSPFGLLPVDGNLSIDDPAAKQYMTRFRELQIQPSADVLIWLQFGEPSLVIEPTQPFGDLDLTALAELLMSNNSRLLEHLVS
jgi:hypothetical protein